MGNIKDFPELLNPADEDWILIQENKSIPAYKKTQLINIKSGGNSGSYSNVWGYRDGSVNFSINNGNYLVNTPQDVTIDVNGTPDGTEIQLLRTTEDNFLFLTGIKKINGVDVDDDTTINVVYKELPTRLIYINFSYGWLSIPSSSVIVTSPLKLPPDGLTQLFNTASIQATSGNSVSFWDDEINGIDAIQNNTSSQAFYTADIFAQNTFPGLFFDGTKEYDVDVNYLVNQKYTIAIVEARNHASSSYIFGSDSSGTNAALHVGYRNDNEFTVAQYDNDLNATIPLYNENLIPTIWIVSNNNRGKEIYRNGVLISSNNNTDNLVEANNGRIGSALGNYYRGYLGLVAVYIGSKTTDEILDISNAINNTFGVY